MIISENPPASIRKLEETIIKQHNAKTKKNTLQAFITKKKPPQNNTKPKTNVAEADGLSEEVIRKRTRLQQNQACNSTAGSG